MCVKGQSWYTSTISKTMTHIVKGEQNSLCMKCRDFFFVPEEWRAKRFGCGPFTPQARLTFLSNRYVSFVLCLEINTTNTNNILLVSEAHLCLFDSNYDAVFT